VGLANREVIQRPGSNYRASRWFARHGAGQIEVKIVAHPELWNSVVDPNQLENALLNLAINARDAMPDGGKIVIETSNKTLDERVATSLDMPAGDYVGVSVSDNGVGMTPDVVARAFDPFYTTKPLGMGTGLGLSMIHGFVRQSGGQVRIHSHPDHGKRFVCTYREILARKHRPRAARRSLNIPLPQPKE
jgi:signal transduction histidine kinase